MNQAISPGYFGKTVCADSRRGEFDWRNQLVLDSGFWKKAGFYLYRGLNHAIMGTACLF